jgi:3-dehydroquinate synthase
MRTVKVDLGQRSYEVRIGHGLLGRLGELVRGTGVPPVSSPVRGTGILPVSSSVRRTRAQYEEAHGQDAHATGTHGRDAHATAVISDATVAKLYQDQAAESLRAAGVAVSTISFPAGEENKNIQTYAAVMDALLRSTPPIDRDCVIVALGGGVTGDLAGFVAATALRGLRLVQCPTTLLAAVDASVGGKTAVDHPCGKNLIGAFHQPSMVIIDVATLATLGAPLIRDGLAECIKHAAISDWAMLDFIERNAAAILSAQADVCEELIAANVAIKAAVVAADEREAGVRSHLNFGHTIGHAIELLAGLGKMGHGQAVALGMIAAWAIAESRGLVGSELRTQLVRVLDAVGLATKTGELDSQSVWTAMQHDKKAKGGRVRMVLPVSAGKVAIFDDIDYEETVKALLRLSNNKQSEH